MLFAKKRSFRSNEFYIFLVYSLFFFFFFFEDQGSYDTWEQPCSRDKNDSDDSALLDGITENRTGNYASIDDDCDWEGGRVMKYADCPRENVLETIGESKFVRRKLISLRVTVGWIFFLPLEAIKIPLRAFVSRGNFTGDSISPTGYVSSQFHERSIPSFFCAHAGDNRFLSKYPTLTKPIHSGMYIYLYTYAAFKYSIERSSIQFSDKFYCYPFILLFI